MMSLHWQVCLVGYSGAAGEREGHSSLLGVGGAVAPEQYCTFLCRGWYGLPVTILRGSTAAVAALVC